MLVGSVGGRSALPFLGPYAASKHALEAIADSLRVELAPWGISVSIVEPASVKTAIWTKGAAQADVMRAGISHDRDELYAARIERFRAVALKRGPGIDPDVVARAVEHALTASRPKARYLVGRDAHIRAWIERLPTRLRDRVLAKALDGVARAPAAKQPASGIYARSKSAIERISILRLRVVDTAAEPLMAEAAHLVDDREQGVALRRQRVLDARR